MSEEIKDEVVCYILVRTELNMPVGKVAAQVGHAVQYMLESLDKAGPTYHTQWQWDWRKSSAKVVLATTLPQLMKIINDVDIYGCKTEVVVDEGRTCVDPNTLTVAILEPMPRSIAKQFVGHLKLLK